MRLYLFQLASFGGRDGSSIPVPGYLVQTDDGASVVVDTGYPRGVMEATRQPDFAGPPVTDARFVADALAAVGVAPDDVDVVVLTHLDPDHAGGVDAFPDAEIVVQRAEYEAAKAGGQLRYDLTRSHWDRPELRYRLVDGDTTLLPGIELIETGGHAPGHQSVLLRLSETGPVLLVADAIDAAGLVAPDTIPDETFGDAEGVRRTGRKLRDLIERDGVALVVYGHDAKQWATLRLAPEFYG